MACHQAFFSGHALGLVFGSNKLYRYRSAHAFTLLRCGINPPEACLYSTIHPTPYYILRNDKR